MEGVLWPSEFSGVGASDMDGQRLSKALVHVLLALGKSI